ncbi:monovalent cation:H+ antiporter, CPA1 (nhx1) [Lobulomyces angularis]|nr:monovalent cation:H+ antiporter, CPA1 (nhx1) [Lobulomyces angularis]
MENPTDVLEGHKDDIEIETTWTLFIFIALLFSILWVSYFLQRNRIRVIHETVVSIFLGMFVGLVIRLYPSDHVIQYLVTFDSNYFFNLLLPPIILNSGYDLKRRSFFRNFGSILIFALLGTMISTFVTGTLIYIFLYTGISGLSIGYLDSIIFGAILSSTDPVTILSIFHQMKVDPTLYSIIFGESMLNDSVAIVLFSTLKKFKGQDISVQNLLSGTGMFAGVFLGSTLIGVIIALICALMLKNSNLYLYPSLESCLVSLIAFASYLLSNGIELSGIVSLLFCGITMKHYCYDNLSVRSKRTTKYMFRVLSQLSENFVFIYLGVALFTMPDFRFLPLLIIFTLVVIMGARYVSTVPLALAINWINVKLYKRDEAIPRNHQLMLWWAGLRGTIAFALSFKIDDEVSGPGIRSTILIVCVISILILGGSTNFALQYLDIKTGVGSIDHQQSKNYVDEDTDSSMDEESWKELKKGQNSLSPCNSEVESEYSLESIDNDASHWFIDFDDHFVKPIFTRKKNDFQELNSNERFRGSKKKNANSTRRFFFNNNNSGEMGYSSSEEGLMLPRIKEGKTREFGKNKQNEGTKQKQKSNFFSRYYNNEAGPSFSTATTEDKKKKKIFRNDYFKKNQNNLADETEDFRDGNGNIWKKVSSKTSSLKLNSQDNYDNDTTIELQGRN